MNKPDVKKLVLLNLPYVFAFYFADKIAAVFRLAPGTEFIDKLTNGFAVFGSAFANPLPSFHPVDLLIGLSAGVLLKLAVYVKGKNRKKFRQGEEYGSARWGKPEDIKPYTDPELSNNVILTQTEFLTMNSRPKQPKYARNKNILVIGGSGSGKTRFFVKPNLMQMHSSYVVTDPKGLIKFIRRTDNSFLHIRHILKMAENRAGSRAESITERPCRNSGKSFLSCQLDCGIKHLFFCKHIASGHNRTPFLCEYIRSVTSVFLL